jgi:hypothetical protein
VEVRVFSWAPSLLVPALLWGDKVRRERKKDLFIPMGLGHYLYPSGIGHHPFGKASDPRKGLFRDFAKRIFFALLRAVAHTAAACVCAGFPLTAVSRGTNDHPLS